MIGQLIVAAAIGVFTLVVMSRTVGVMRSLNDPRGGRHRALPVVPMFIWLGVWEISMGAALIYLGATVSSAITLIMLGLFMLVGAGLYRRVKVAVRNRPMSGDKPSDLQ